MDFTTILGLTAAFLTTFAFIPQALKVIRTKNTKDLSLPMYYILTFGIILWLVYGILSHDFPVTIANAITFCFVFTILALKIKYK